MLFLVLQAMYTCVIFVVFQVKGKHTKKKKIRLYLSSAKDAVLQLVLCSLVLTFCISSIYITANDKHYSKDFWRVGIFAIIFGWTNLLLLSSKFPAFGEYTLIFGSILTTFLKITFFGFVLIMASTIVLRMLFYNPIELVNC